jgi:CRP-like cAMP-binding protein
MESGALGKTYNNGEMIVRAGETGDCMYVIQAGQVEVLQMKGDQEVRLAVMDEGDFFGEMALFEREVRSATVRALGEARVLTIDKRTFLRRVHEDPSLAYRLVQKMSQRIRKLNAELVRLTGSGG